MCANASRARSWARMANGPAAARVLQTRTRACQVSDLLKTDTRLCNSDTGLTLPVYRALDIMILTQVLNSRFRKQLGHPATHGVVSIIPVVSNLLKRVACPRQKTRS